MALVDFKIEDRIAVVTIDNPPVNALNQQLRQELLAAVEAIEADEAIDAVVLLCAGRTFVAGADIHELGNPQKPYLPDVLQKIDQSAKTWVAALHGTALGGGLELAMACHGRVAAKGTKLGLPEVTLGVIPGSGGTVRLPRLIPLEKAISLITTGKPISAQEGLASGLIDRIADVDLFADATRYARELLDSPVAPLLGRDVKEAGNMDWDAARRSVTLKARGALAPSKRLMPSKMRRCLIPNRRLPRKDNVSCGWHFLTNPGL